MSVAVGSRLGHYEIRSQLGTGGMGEVYLARDMDLRRQVAIKVLRSEFTTSESRVRRFQQEARAASALNHPNILTIYEIGTQNSTYFIASEYIEGRTLREDMAGPPIKTTNVLDILTQVASALVAAHAAGVVHRDIKPENIMLRHDRIVKVLDFGLAKLTEREITNTAPTLLDTEEGVVMGTVRYMSPEQVKAMAIDGRTDVWSLGVVIHEMLTGRMPFPGSTATEVIAAVLEREPQPLVSRGEEIPSELKRIVLKALRKDCEERYQTMSDMFVDLKSLRQELTFDAMKRSTRPQQDGKSGATTGRLITTGHKTSAPSSRTDYLRGVVKSHKVGLAIAGVMFLAFAAIAYFAYFARGSADNPLTRRAAITSIAVLPFVNASNNPEAEYLSDGISESLINSLSQLPQLKVIARSSSFKFRGKEVNPEEVANALGVEGILTGRLIQLGDQLQISAELVDTRDGTNVWGDHYNRKAADLLTIQSEISRDISEKLRLKLTGDEQVRLTKRYTENAQAYQLYVQGRYHWNKRTPESLSKAIDYFNQAIKVDPKYALAYAGLADCYVLLFDYDANAPKDSSQKGKVAALTALEIDGTLAEARTSLAFVKERYDWDFIGAEKEYKRAIELNPNYAIAHQWYAEYLSSMGRSEEAIKEIERAHELDPLALSINVTLGATYHMARQYDAAIRQLRTTLDLYPNYPRAHFRLGLTYLQKKMHPEAIAELQKISGGDSMFDAALAYVYGMSGQKAEAQKLLDEMTQRSKREYVSPYYIAVARVGLGERHEALASLEKAYQDRDYRLRLIKAEPVWDSLRSDSRFQDIQRRVGLPQ